MDFPARNFIIADLLDRIADDGDSQAELTSDHNQGIPTQYAKSPATVRTATAPGTPSDPLPYSAGGQPNVGCDSLNLARTGDAIGSDVARVLRKGRLFGERNGLSTPRRDG